MKKLSKIFACFALFVLVFATPFVFAGCNGRGVNYDITLLVNNSSYGEVYGAGSYAKGEYVIIAASPKEGYEFEKWVDSDNSLISTDSITKIKVEQDQVYMALFKIKSTQKHAVIESVQLSLNGTGLPIKSWDSEVTSVIATNWHVKINGYEYGSSGAEEVLLNNNTQYYLNGTRRSFTSTNSNYYVDNKFNTNVNVMDKIQAYVTLKINGTQMQQVQLTQVDASIVFTENSNKLEVRYNYPDYGQVVVTFIYFVD